MRHAGLILALALALGACKREPAPDVPLSPAEMVEQARKDCARSGGQMLPSGIATALVCIRDMPDAGRQCTRGTDCQGDCLARSGTCAPVSPLFGCNEILMDQGQRAVLCRD